MNVAIIDADLIGKNKHRFPNLVCMKLCHEAAPRGSRCGTQKLKNHVERSRIPDALCDHIVEICEEWIDKEWRICSECGSVMEDGFFVEPSEYYCSEDCLHKHYTEEEYQKMYNEDEAYWTHWY